ncbi:hypothetical protein JHK85_037152 [Glycine max]|nr:hypothetical protein JHK85_037152 [Glycine max]KAG4977134.1 hypothetical protein JHK86_036608 [Glycine max]
MTNRSPRHNFTAAPGLALLFNRLATHTPILTKRGLSISFLTAFLVSLAGEDANAAILEADDDEERLEKVKRDRKKRLERQGVIKSSTKETGLVLQK